jgi:hypothetical protein
VRSLRLPPFFQLFSLISPRSPSSERAFSGGSASFVRGGGWGSEEFGPEAEAFKADTNGAAGAMTVGPGGTHWREAGFKRDNQSKISAGHSGQAILCAAGGLRKMYREGTDVH